MIVTTLTGILLAIGAFACVTGGVGLHRFPDVYARLHASGIQDTLGAGLVVSGLLVWTALGDDGFVHAALAAHGPGAALAAAKPGLLVSFKLVSVLFFLWVSGTTAAHAVVKAAWLDGLKPWTGPDGEDA